VFLKLNFNYLIIQISLSHNYSYAFKNNYTLHLTQSVYCMNKKQFNYIRLRNYFIDFDDFSFTINNNF